MKQQRRQNRVGLYRLAARQGGYFSATQAAALGIDRRNHHHRVSSGAWERVSRGVFRLPEIPLPDFPEPYLVSLWSMGGGKTPEAVFSHGTALGLLGLEDSLPPELDVLLPRGYRRQLHPPAAVRARAGDPPGEDVTRVGPLRVTTAFRAILDMLRDEAEEPDMVRLHEAYVTGRRRGLIPADAMNRPDLSEGENRLVMDWEEEV